MSGAPSLLSPLPWDFDAFGDNEEDIGGPVCRSEVVSGRRASVQRLARSAARPPQFLISLGDFVKGTCGACVPEYRSNPLRRAAASTKEGDGCDVGGRAAGAGAEDDDDDDDHGASVARRWVKDARRLCDWEKNDPRLDVAHSRGGAVPAGRGERKRQQVLNIVMFVAPFLARKPDAVVVDFCCGGAHQSLPLAAFFSDATFVLLDAKRRSLDVAEERIAAMGLRNVRIVCAMIEDFHEPFDVGIALHACGGASDIAMEKCVRANAAYVIAPCCVGKIALAATAKSRQTEMKYGAQLSSTAAPEAVAYPRSRAAAAVTSTAAYVSIAQAADFGSDGYDACGATAEPLLRGGGGGGGGERDDEEEEEELTWAVKHRVYRDSSDDEEEAALDSIEEEEYTSSSSSSSPPPPQPRPSSLKAASSATRGEEIAGAGAGGRRRGGAAGELRLQQLRREKQRRLRNRAPKMSLAARLEREAQRRACKAVVEADRNAYAAERGYRVYQVLMEPAACTPKNDILVGIPRRRQQQQQQQQRRHGILHDVETTRTTTRCDGGGDDGGCSTGYTMGKQSDDNNDDDGDGGDDGGGWWMSYAADDYEAVLSERAETPSSAVFVSMLTTTIS